MTKKKYLILWAISGAIVLWLLWRNREKVAPTIFNEAPPNYMDVAYPQVIFSTPTVKPTVSSASCGCNPAASQYLANAGNAIKKSEQQLEEQLKQYTDSINNFFATNTVQ